MCGIAGLIHRGSSGSLGQEMTAMLQSLVHRGPDSTGFALYGAGSADRVVMRFKVAEQEDLKSGFNIRRNIKERRSEVDRRLQELGATIIEAEQATDYAFRYRLAFSGDVRRSMARTGSGTRAWQPNRMSTSVQPIPTGPTRSMTSLSSTTAS